MGKAGEMALLLYRVETNTIIILGRWLINIIICYLHTSAQSLVAVLVSYMVQHGYYALILPDHKV